MISNDTPKRLMEVIERVRSKYSDYNIIMDDFFTDSGLTDFYKTEAENIGFNFNNTDDRLINYNIFSNKIIEFHHLLMYINFSIHLK